MSVRLVFACDGCDAETQGTGSLRRHFVSVSGRDYGFGSALWNDPNTLAPPGWVASDPYTFATYCPTCWASIEAGKDCGARLEAGE
jgi:hypothetical protein